MLFLHRSFKYNNFETGEDALGKYIIAEVLLAVGHGVSNEQQMLCGGGINLRFFIT